MERGVRPVLAAASAAKPAATVAAGCPAEQDPACGRRSSGLGPLLGRPGRQVQVSGQPNYLQWQVLGAQVKVGPLGGQHRALPCSINQGQYHAGGIAGFLDNVRHHTLASQLLYSKLAKVIRPHRSYKPGGVAYPGSPYRQGGSTTPSHQQNPSEEWQQPER